jgi:hypothetical protein
LPVVVEAEWALMEVRVVLAVLEVALQELSTHQLL